MFSKFLRRSLVWLCLVAVLVAATSVPAVACPTCSDGIAQNDPGQQSLVQGYFWSILFMMSMPFLLLGGFSAYMYYEIRKARAREAAGEPAATSGQPAVSQQPGLGQNAAMPSAGG